MKKKIISWILFLLPCLASAQDNPFRLIELDSVIVPTVRLLSETGLQKTVLDSTALRDNISGSLADVLALNSTIFIKSYGRATLSTASFRGTAPSHTQVTWNGMKMNSPMLGMVDFSLIPSYFIDQASLYHGASSVGVTGGGLGGAVSLGTRPPDEKGIGLRYVQGISSFNTWDQFLRLTVGAKKWQSSTRVFYATSDNDFTYRNPNKWEFIYDEDRNIIGKKRPVERNKNGQFDDFHLLQEFFYRGTGGSKWNLAGWYMDSRRGVPMLDVSYHEQGGYVNEQHERTLRTTLGWEKSTSGLKLSAQGGYFYTDLRYIYDVGLGEGGGTQPNVHSFNFVHTAYGRFGAEYAAGEKWLFSGNVSLHQHIVDTEDKAKTVSENDRVVGYDKSRSELAMFGAVRYKPSERLGLAVNARQEVIGGEFTPFIPAAFAEYTLSRRGMVLLKASAARNYRHPSLNDLYFMPGGNDELRPEKGYTMDAGVSFRLKNRRLEWNGEATWFDSHIEDWILWLPLGGGKTGFWTPFNIKEVHSYGLELKSRLDAGLGGDWRLIALGQYALTRSVNRGEPFGVADESVGKQLPYIPKHSAGVTGRLRWRDWEFAYKWNYYSVRYATSSNEAGSRVWDIPPYFMSDVSLERHISMRWAFLSLKLTVNNLFAEEYVSVLSRPMPGRNYGFFIEIAPRWWR